jgi:hypothetical protein
MLGQFVQPLFLFSEKEPTGTHYYVLSFYALTNKKLQLYKLTARAAGL